MQEVTKRRLRFLTGFAVYFAALWLLWNTPIVYPLKIFVVLLHEISHGVMAVLTGGSIESIRVTAKQGGLCECPGGSRFLVLSAGYLGSLGWGAAILMAARGRGSIPKIAAGVIGVIVIAVTLLYVRNSFGLLFGVAFGGGLVAVGYYLPTDGTAALLTALGLTSCLYAVLDIKSDILDRPEVLSDARLLAEYTGIPTVIWGVLWIFLALLFSAWLFRKALARAGTGPAKENEVFRA
jgi:hypothetical protein